jgi:hypothetical protein
MRLDSGFREVRLSTVVVVRGCSFSPRVTSAPAPIRL